MAYIMTIPQATSSQQAVVYLSPPAIEAVPKLEEREGAAVASPVSVGATVAEFLVGVSLVTIESTRVGTKVEGVCVGVNVGAKPWTGAGLRGTSVGTCDGGGDGGFTT